MKVLSIIFVIFGSLFFLMGLYVEPMFPAFCMSILFFAIAVLFWRNSANVGDRNYHDDMGLLKDTTNRMSSEKFEDNQRLLKKIRELRNKK